MNRQEEEALVAEIESRKGTGRELEGFERIGTVKAPRNRGSVFSMRIRTDELIEIERAARAAGVSVSEFIRHAALEQARTAGRRAEAVEEVTLMVGKLTARLETLGVYKREKTRRRTAAKS